jgi:hypothetical protein
MVEVLVSQEELRRVSTVAAEAFVVSANQVGLADRGGGLELGEIIGASAESELADSGSDGTRAHQGDATTGGDDYRDLLREVVDSIGVEPTVVSREHARADLDHPSPG